VARAQPAAPRPGDILRDLSRRGDLDVPDPNLAVIQFCALTVYPHIVRSTFGVQLDQRVTEDLLTSGIDKFFSYYTVKDTRSHMPYTADPRVDAYIDALPDWQQAICREVRDLARAADPEVRETIKRTSQPYFVLQGNICALLAAKDHVNVFLYDGGIVPDPDGIITGGHDNKTARTVAIRRGQPINAPALSAMFRQIIANNRAGGWRELKRTT
jgi:hypothetical protein